MRRAALSILVVAAGLAVGTPAAGDVTAISASAVGLLAVENDQIVAGPQPIENLPPDGGGPFTETDTDVTIPALNIEFGELSASVEGSGVGTHEGESRANVIGESFELENVLFADFDANCSVGADGAVGGTAFLGGDIIVNGSPQPLPANPSPGTVIDASPSVRVILNEQSVANQPGSASIRVTAMHIIVLDEQNETDIVVGEVQCHATGPDVLAGVGAPAPGPETPTAPVPSSSDATAPRALTVTPRFTG